MINIDNIFKTPIGTTPWEYQIVDNILTDDFYKTLVNESDKLKQVLSSQPIDQDGIWMFKAKKYGISQEVIDTIFNINQLLLKNATKILNQFSIKNVSDIGYFSIPRLGFCPPGAFGEIHDDGDTMDKTMIMVIYISPEKSKGTRLYSANDPNSFVKELDWKENRAFIFSPVKNVTWHDFVPGEQERVTLLFYYERIEDLSYINRLSIEKKEWFYDNFDNDNLLIELKDCV
jgi:hypothetical protein